MTRRHLSWEGCVNVRDLATVPARAMVETLTALESHNGSVEDYLRSAGLDDLHLHRARKRLRP